MKKLIAIAALVAFVASPALADLAPQDHSNAQMATIISQVKIGDIDSGPRADTAMYESHVAGASGYLAYPAGTGVLGNDDYTVTAGVGNTLTALKFVGGVTATSQVVYFEWYELTTGGMTYAFVDSVGVALPQAGNFIWSIGLSTPFDIPASGVLQVVANTTTAAQGQFFVTSHDAVVTGSNATTFGPEPYVHAFSFYTPEPTTLALLGAGVMVLLRRRR